MSVVDYRDQGEFDQGRLWGMLRDARLGGSEPTKVKMTPEQHEAFYGWLLSMTNYRTTKFPPRVGTMFGGLEIEVTPSIPSSEQVQ